MELIVLGVGGLLSLEEEGTSFLVRAGGCTLAVEVPFAYRRSLKAAAQAGADVPAVEDIDHLFVSHLHGDHMGGLEEVGFYCRFHGPERPRLWAPQPVLDDLWDGRLRGAMGSLLFEGTPQPQRLEDFFEPHGLSWEGTHEIGPFTARLRRTQHPVPTSALLLEADGVTLGYSADTAFDPELMRFLEPADLILHEAGALSPGSEVHTHISSLAALPAELRRRMLVVHYGDGAHAEGLRLARPGETVTVGAPLP